MGLEVHVPMISTIIRDIENRPFQNIQKKLFRPAKMREYSLVQQIYQPLQHSTLHTLSTSLINALTNGNHCDHKLVVGLLGEDDSPQLRLRPSYHFIHNLILSKFSCIFLVPVNSLCINVVN